MKTRPAFTLVLSVSLCACLALAGAFAFATSKAQAATKSNIAKQMAKNITVAFDQAEKGNLSLLLGNQMYSAGVPASGLTAQEGLPAKYDMREHGRVTSVKLQNPWGDCWGFAAIAASESSLISETGMNAKDVDLSELQLGWFAYKALPSGMAGTAGTQAGEGLYPIGEEAKTPLDEGGLPFTATSILALGIGPVPESVAPYRNAEGAIEYVNGVPFCYAESGDWSVPESKRFIQDTQLELSRILPSPAATNDWGNYRYNEEGTLAMKREILDGRAVEIAFHADESMPGVPSANQYINMETWAQYTYEPAQVNHAVTIVGWDDSYSKGNFMAGHKPPADGAWIVKNSWGAADQEFPNYNVWGVDGNGYFYLSYYDQSINLPETFDFDTDNFNGSVHESRIDQYDYLPAFSVNTAASADPVTMANIFKASEDQKVTAISVDTAYQGTTVHYDVYALKDGYANPTDGKLMASGSKTYPYGGFHRIELGDKGFEVAKDKAYSVVVSQECEGEHLAVAYQCINGTGASALTRSGYSVNYYGKGVVNKGESLLYENGEWADWTQVLKEIESEEGRAGLVDFDNFSIKAFYEPTKVEKPDEGRHEEDKHTDRQDIMAMYRVYNPNSGEHFYTANPYERDACVQAGWSYEGIGWYSPVTSSIPIYRLYSGTDHFYTMNIYERDHLMSVGWSYEGVCMYAEDDDDGLPLYREFNPYVQPWAPRNNSGSHNYTLNINENNMLVSVGWRAEGIAWYTARP